MSHIEILKQRANMLVDELLKTEGALREVRHLISFFENEEKAQLPKEEVEMACKGGTKKR
jgi:hypothetical protein